MIGVTIGVTLWWNLLHLTLLVCLPLSQIVWGEIIAERLFSKCPEKPKNLVYEFFIGLSAQLFFVIALGSLFFATPIGLSVAVVSYKFFWCLVTACLFLPCGLRRKAFFAPLRGWIFWSSTQTGKLSLNGCLWFVVSLLIGVTLFGTGFESGYSPGRSVSTIWVNNYSDLPFHLGMISGFLIGGNFPPEYQVYAGVPLSYPFFINLWTALLAWPAGSLLPLPVIFLVQWMVLWWIVFRALDVPGLAFAPWAVLFGGGAFSTLRRLFSEPDGATTALSHLFIEKGEPWAVFLSTLWVPQRAFLLGVAILLVGAAILLDERCQVRHRILSVTVLFSLSLLAHTHAMLIGLLFVALYAAWFSLGRWEEGVVKSYLVGLSPVVLSLPFLIGKEGIVKLGVREVWLYNTPLLFFGIAFLCVKRSSRLIGAILAILYLLGNVVQLAVWDWDQIKLFVSLYVLTMFSLRFLDVSRKIIQLVLVVAILPGLLETVTILSQWKSYIIYSQEQLKQTAEIESATALHAVIIDKPIHNSPVTLAGRSLFCGYDGTLYSHGIDYKERERVNQAVLNGSGSETALQQYLARTPDLRNRKVIPGRYFYPSQ